MPPSLLRRGSSRLLLLALAAACIGNSRADESFGRAFKQAYDALLHGRYLEASDTLQRYAVGPDGKVLDIQALGLWNQFQVDITGEPYPASANSRQDDPSIVRQLSGAVAEPAISAIVDQARHTNIVILNEDHIHPRQRAFALQVAKALRPLGYDILALEALNNRGDSASRMSALKRRGYVVLSDGFYTRDPVYADFIRQALRLGYAPASYEDVAKRDASGDELIRAREQGQAENLGAVIKRRPKSKVLIYVGGSHLAEKPLAVGNGKLSWMAARLVKLTGINPLTVDQTTLQSDCEICGRLSHRSGEPVVFFSKSKSIVVGQFEGAVDLQVFEPEQRPVDGRPAWLLRMGRTPVPVPRSLLPMRGRRLVQAFVASESQDSIPMDQFVIATGQQPAKFMLPDVKVRFSFQQAAQ